MQEAVITCLPSDLAFLVMVVVVVHTIISIPKDISTLIRLYRNPPPKREIAGTVIATFFFWILTGFFIYVFAKGFRI